MYEFLDRRYAQALFNECRESGNTEVVLEEFEELVNLFHSNDGLIKIFKNPQINKYNKKMIVTEMFAGSIEKELLEFLILLIDKGRILHLHEKYDQFKEIYLENINTAIAKVGSAVELSDDETSLLRKKLEDRYGKKIIIDSYVDESLIGGIVVNVADEVIDGTIKHRLKEVEKIIKAKQQ